MGVPVAARLQRSRHAHRVDDGGQLRRPGDRRRGVFGTINGMAPRARISVYKALWSTQDRRAAALQLATSSAAIDQAVADGVDVINYSICGTTTNFLDPVEVAFLFAADAGVFVAPRPATAVRRPSRSRTRALDHDGRGRHAQPRRPGLGHARQRRDLLRRVVGRDRDRRRSSTRRRGSRRAARPRPARTPRSKQRLCFAGCSTRPRSPARSSSATAVSTRASTRASRCRRRAASG